VVVDDVVVVAAFFAVVAFFATVVVVVRAGVEVDAAAFPCKPISAAMTAAAAVEVAATAPVTRFTRRLPAVRRLMIVLSTSMNT
jgi:hypothetical protein